MHKNALFYQKYHFYLLLPTKRNIIGVLGIVIFVLS